ncbi:MAG TPA: 3'-5' exonuclease [Kiritimatiellia bacterium]|nr:3'-5' exonuclease [Kiritimatiellia bacterium]
MRAKESIITVLDFETTGSVPGWPDQPWQIGMVTLNHGQLDLENTFESLLYIPDRPFNPAAPGNHRLLKKELACAPGLTGLWPELEHRVSEHPLAAHNIGTEKKFLRKLAPLHTLGPWIDTLKLARMVWPELPSHNLGFLLKHLRLKAKTDTLCPGRSEHDAFYDAVGCALLLQHLLDLPGWDRLEIHQLAGAVPREYHRLRNK